MRKKINQEIRKKILSLAGNMTREEIAISVGVSRATIHRIFKESGIRTGQPRAYSIDTVDRVMAFYQNHTLQETQKQFPNIVVT